MAALVRADRLPAHSAGGSAAGTRTDRRRIRALTSVAATFVVFGLFWGGWSVAAHDLEQELGLSHGGFGALLSVCLVGAAVTNAVGGGLAERMGTGRLLSLSLAGWAAVLVAAAVAPVGALFVLVPLLVTTGGLVDVVMNVVSAAAYADRPGGLVRFHALFNVGAAIGAGTMGLMLAAGLRWRWMWAVVATLALLLVRWTARSRMPVGERGESVRLGGTIATLRREHLVPIAVAFALGAMVEAGVELWGVIFLRTSLPSGLAVGATSAVAGYLVAATARAVLGPSAGQRGAAGGVAIGAGLAGAGLLLLAAAPNRYLAGLGFVVGAGGISMCWPLLIASAAADRDRPGPVIGAVTAVGYLGFVVGPTALGLVAELTSVRAGLVVLAAVTVVVALLPAVSGSRRSAVGRAHG